MSKEAITKVVQRAISDAGFRRQLGTDPSGALRGFDLSADEAAALRAGDAGRLSALGVDQRMSKAFALGGAAAAATRPGGVDLNASGLNAGGANALSNADATGGAGSVRSALVSSSDANAAMIDDGATGARTIIPTEPGGNLTADLDGVAGMSNASVDDSSEAYLTKVGYDPSVAASKNADVSGGTAGEGTAFLDDSESHLTSIDYDPNAATSAVTDAHDRGDGATTSAVTDAHDRGDVTRIDDDADSAGTGAASEQGPNLSS